MYSRTSNQFLATSCNKRCAMCVCVRVCQRFPRVHPEPRDPGQIIEREREIAQEIVRHIHAAEILEYTILSRIPFGRALDCRVSTRHASC